MSSWQCWLATALRLGCDPSPLWHEEMWGGCRFMASQPGKWDYTLAGVPSPLTDELESQQLAKQVSCSNLTSPIVSYFCITHPPPLVRPETLC